MKQDVILKLDVITRHLRGNIESKLAYESIVYTYSSLSDPKVIYGAYYGYCGGATNDGGFFKIIEETFETFHFNNSDIDALEEN
jgi:hypothetical protein